MGNGISRQRAYQKRQAAIMQDARELNDRYFEKVEITRHKLGGRLALHVEWSFTEAQLEVVTEVAESHGLTADEFLKKLAKAAMDRRHPPTKAS